MLARLPRQSHLARRRALIAAALIGGALAAPAAQARPIVPGATPLALIAPMSSGGCPAPTDADGSSKLAFYRSLAGKGRPATYSALLSLTTPDPIFVVCDPAQAAAQTFGGPVTGETQIPVRDLTWWGTRALTGDAIDGKPNALRIGDRLELPAGSTGTRVDVTVAAGGGARTARLPVMASAIRRIEIQGTAAAPIVVATDEGGATTATPIAAVSTERFSVRLRRVGDEAVATVKASRGSVVFTMLEAQRSSDVDFGVIDKSGRRESRWPLGKRAEITLRVLTTNPITRTETVRRCTIVRTTGRASCKPSKSGRGGSIADRLGTAVRPAAELAPAREAERATAARARRAPTTLPTSVVSIDSPGRGGMGFAAGDLNGDGRPDFERSRWNDSVTTRLLVSEPGGGWRKVAVRGTNSLESGSVTRPDLDGDGRAELRDANWNLLTDAFSSATVPASVDLGMHRSLSNRDLVAPPITIESVFSSLAGYFDPTGSLADVTGDSRPEVVLETPGPLVLPSEAFQRGRAPHLALVAPVASWNQWTNAAFDISGDDESNEVEDLRANISSKRVVSRLYTVAPRDRGAEASAARPIDLKEVDARGTALSSRTFSGEGWPMLLDVDPATGDALVRLHSAKACPPSMARVVLCAERIVRIDAAGNVSASVSYKRSAGTGAKAAFITDGPDTDGSLEAVIAANSELGGLSVLGSERAGSVAIDDLPVLDLGSGRRASQASDFSSVTLANGSRWLATRTNPDWERGETSPGSEFLVLRLK